MLSRRNTEFSEIEALHDKLASVNFEVCNML